MFFYSESINSKTYKDALNAINQTDVILIIGAGGEVIPANSLPYLAKERNNAVIIFL